MAGVKAHSHGVGGARRAVDAGTQQGGAVKQADGVQPQGSPGRGKKLGHRKRTMRAGGAGQGTQGAGHLKHADKAGKADKADKAAKAEQVGATGVAGGGGIAGCDAAMTGATELGAAPTTAAALAEPTTATQLAGALGAPAGGATQLATGANPLIATALQQLGGSQLATQVLTALASGNAKIETLSDSAMAAKYGARTKGAFDPATNSIILPQSIASDPAQLRLVLFHEGVHWLQDNVQGGAEALGGPIGDALKSAGAIRPTTSKTDDMQHDEAQAYLLEAQLATELGIRDKGLGADSSGRNLGYQAVLQRVRSTAEYA